MLSLIVNKFSPLLACMARIRPTKRRKRRPCGLRDKLIPFPLTSTCPDPRHSPFFHPAFSIRPFLRYFLRDIRFVARASSVDKRFQPANCNLGCRKYPFLLAKRDFLPLCWTPLPGYACAPVLLCCRNLCDSVLLLNHVRSWMFLLTGTKRTNIANVR